jgi:hypothetical protein
LKEDAVRPELIREVVEAYGAVRENLLRHAPGYPTQQDLLSRVKSGNPKRGVANIGAGKDTEGSDWIISVADQPDDEPLNIVIWGGSTELAQALWRVRNDRTAKAVKQFVSRLRVHAIGHQDNTGPWILENFPDLFYILSAVDASDVLGPARARGSVTDSRLSVYRGMYLGGDESLTAREWIDRHVREGHGPLGALYPPKTWTAPNPHSALKEGDTPSWFYFLPNGLSDPEHPDWGCWGGRFRLAGRGLYRDARDTVGDVTDGRATVWRWRAAYQADFQARMDWCVKPYAEANHPPVAVVNGDRSRRVLMVSAAPGSRVTLSAEGSSDPDRDALSYRWWVYPEAGASEGAVALEGADTAEVAVRVPEDAGRKEIHVVLEVTDDGSPSLTGYRRVIVSVTR